MQAEAVPVEAVEPDYSEIGAQRVILERGSPEPEIFTPRPVVQPIPSVEPDAYAADRDYAEPPRALHPAMRRTTAAGQPYVYRAGRVPALPAGGRVVQFDRQEWLAACADRLTPAYAYADERDGDGKIAGAVVGAVVGGIAGNRIAGRGSRTAGTLIGAGAGALGGMAVGGALDRQEERVSGIYEDDYAYSYRRCEAYLDQYMASAYSGGLDGRYSATGDYFLVPVTVVVPQRAYYSDGTPVRP
ncbi:glycine zipper 2TM domain-containing protein [Qipengyuania sp. 6B39]|nr:glycine zipper 2TM domain-containing protein [Qipengyuania proteolytica]